MRWIEGPVDGAHDGRLVGRTSINFGVVGYWALVDMLFVGNERVAGLLARSWHFFDSWKRRSRDSS